jgi:OHCU decarboxylase
VSVSLGRLNALPLEEAEAGFLSCCGSREWARRLAAERPFRTVDDLADAADRIWRALSKEDWLEAFAAHPKIGSADQETVAGPGFNLHPPPNSDRARAWSRQEQEGTRGASPETLANLADANREYEERFGHIFIVCASGKNAGEMLALLEARLRNDPETELAIAAEEQRKITRLRLEKILGE